MRDRAARYRITVRYQTCCIRATAANVSPYRSRYRLPARAAAPPLNDLGVNPHVASAATFAAAQDLKKRDALNASPAVGLEPTVGVHHMRVQRRAAYSVGIQCIT